MKCPNCQHEPPAGSMFCNECGVKLIVACATCGAIPPPGSRFCNGCGATLDAEQRGGPESDTSSLSIVSTKADRAPRDYTPKHLAEKILQSSSALEGERKTITVVFADLKGSTALIEGLDPEVARGIVDPALQLMMDAVHRYEGYVAQVLGDGILALFGAPIAQEDHAQRALFASLHMQDAMRHYSDRVRLEHGAPVALRVGVNTGEVVVRSIRKENLQTDYVPVGHSINLAARMEQMATPGSILVTAYTQKLVDGLFSLKPLGEAAIKGVLQPLAVFEVTGIGESRTRLEVAERRGLTRFVGREHELTQMLAAREATRARHGQVIGVMGEPGMGKSRLFHEFRGRLPAGCLSLAAYSVSHGKSSAYLPVITLLKSYCRIEPQDDERTRREKITGKVLTLDRDLEDILPYLFALLDIEEQPSALAQMDAQVRRRRTFEALKRLFLRESLKQPLILVFEDLHWVDGETQGFLDFLCESIASARLLLLTNYRPEYRHEWGQKTYYTQLRLAPLGPAEMDELMTFLLGDDASLPPVKALILEKAEGTPFFIEEVVQALIEDGTLAGTSGTYRLTQHTAALQLPPTVQGVLAARIDRLAADEKAFLQQLAVVGRNFPLSLVGEVVPQSDEDRYRLLGTLQRKEFLYEQPAFPEVEYVFKHALTQEVAYNTVLQEQRKTLHEQTALAIERLHRTNLEDHYPALAHHYSRSGNVTKAVEYLSLAGEQAVRQSANAEAITHFTAALALFETLPDAGERARQELMLQLNLGASLMSSVGYVGAKVEHTYTRAQSLCDEVGEPFQVAQVLFGRWAFRIVKQDFAGSRALCEQILGVAELQQDTAVSLVVHTLVGITTLLEGDFASAQNHLEHAAELYDPDEQRDLAYLLGQDLGLLALSYAAQTRWFLGYPDQALQQVQRPLTLAYTAAHPLSLINTLVVVGVVHVLRRDGQAAWIQTQALLSIAEEHGITSWSGYGLSIQGQALVQRAALTADAEQVEEGLVELLEGLAAKQSAGIDLWDPVVLCWIAEAYAHLRQPQKGMEALTEALTIMERTDEGWFDAELYRLYGELARQVGNDGSAAENAELDPRAVAALFDRCGVSSAEECFERAIAIAQRQQAKSLELRAATSLARLRQQQGKVDEARGRLTEIYGWFTEGFDTPDLQDAKALLEELG